MLAGLWGAAWLSSTARVSTQPSLALLFLLTSLQDLVSNITGPMLDWKARLSSVPPNPAHSHIFVDLPVFALPLLYFVCLYLLDLWSPARWSPSVSPLTDCSMPSSLPTLDGSMLTTPEAMPACFTRPVVLQRDFFGR
jgi:hypothetical protein